MSVNSNIINTNELPKVYYGTTPPTSTTNIPANSKYYVTPLGNALDHANATELWMFDKQSNQWVKSPGGAESTPIDIPAAIAIGTQSELNALVDKPVGGKYIVTDGVNKGDILVWNDIDGDGIGDEFGILEVPTNQMQYTVLTNATGELAGVYQYDIVTDTWIRNADIAPSIPDVEDNTAVGGIKFPKQRLSYLSNSGPLWIQYDQVTGMGANASGATAMGTTSVANGALPNTIRKSPYTFYDIATPYSQIIDYRVFAVDVCQSRFGGAMIDQKGNLFIVGDTTFTQYGLNLAAATTSLAWSPSKFWTNHSRKLIGMSICQDQRALMVQDNEGGLWIVAATGATGVYGDGTVVNNSNWHKINVPEQGWKKYQIDNTANFAMALSNSGDLYAWGTNTANRINTTATTSIISTPVLVQTNVKDFDFDSNSVMVIKNDGTRVAVGTNTNGKFGNGGTTALTTYTSVPSNGFDFEKVFKNPSSNAYFYITTDKKLVMTGYQDLDSGVSGVTAASNILTPTICGLGAYQGSVVDVHPHLSSTALHTNQGEVWVCTRHASYGENGVGISGLAGTNIGLNVFRKTPVPTKVIKLYSTSENTSTVQIPTYAVLSEEGRIYSWSGYYGDFSNSTTYKSAPYEIPTQMFRQGTPVESTVIDIYGTKLGSIATASIASISDIIDGSNNQTVRVAITTTGTSGAIDLTGTTISGADTTFVSLETQRVGQLGTSTIIVNFKINASDIPSLTPPNSQPQPWTINLVANGATPIVLTGSSTRIADAIAGLLTTSLSNYSSATNNSIIPITASEYNSLMTLTGTAKYGATDATMTSNPPNGAGAVANATQSYLPTAFNGTYFASNSYLVAFSIKSKSVTSANNLQGMKIKFGANSYTNLTDYATLNLSTPLAANTQQYFVIKGSTMTPADARFGLYQPNTGGGNVNDMIGGGATVLNARYSATGDVNTLGATATTVYSPAYIQGIMTATKQW